MTPGQKARRQRQRDRKREWVFDEKLADRIDGKFDQTFALAAGKMKGVGRNENALRRPSL